MGQDDGFTLVEALVFGGVLITIMLVTIIGNILVICSIFTYRPLRNVQNMFLVSLAVADITVAVFVMPFNVAYNIMGRWVFGLFTCKMWLTSDVLCCTASILNLCAIALDRYWAIHDPINYAQKRTISRVLTMIALVWGISAIISIPPLLGWNDWPDVFTTETPCKLTEEKAYLIYSSSGSFFIPLIIMSVVYFKIYQATKRRLRERAKATAQVKNPQFAASTATSNATTGGVISKAHSAHGSGSTTACPSTIASGSTMASGSTPLHGASHLAPQVTCDPPSTIMTEEREVTGISDALAAENGLRVTRRSSVGPPRSPQSSPMIKSASPKKFSGSLHRQASRESSDETDRTPTQCIIRIDEAGQPVSSTVQTYWEQRQKISLSRERRAARILGIVMGVFVLCWLPFFLMYVIVPFCETCYLSRGWENFITWLGYVNSALNPMIYTVFNMDFRRAFKKLLFGRCWPDTPTKSRGNTGGAGTMCGGTGDARGISRTPATTMGPPSQHPTATDDPPTARRVFQVCCQSDSEKLTPPTFHLHTRHRSEQNLTVMPSSTQI